ncbi:hypothetical protein WN944_002066 [Citrus x changshan-huyou]|uniref:Uncharacterized protein n=1 Tax=Citrus x changshan-huyou TaxID=2935761 RepID=A0AAP0QVG5_9ROSI
MSLKRSMCTSGSLCPEYLRSGKWKSFWITVPMISVDNGDSSSSIILQLGGFLLPCISFITCANLRTSPSNSMARPGSRATIWSRSSSAFCNRCLSSPSSALAPRLLTSNTRPGRSWSLPSSTRSPGTRLVLLWGCTPLGWSASGGISSTLRLRRLGSAPTTSLPTGVSQSLLRSSLSSYSMVVRVSICLSIRSNRSCITLSWASFAISRRVIVSPASLSSLKASFLVTSMSNRSLFLR